MSPKAAEVLIIGAGVIGASIAFHLTRCGMKPLVIEKSDPAGAVIAGSETAYRIDCLAVGFGFSANLELAQLAGCDVAFNAGLGGWVVKVNEDLETTVVGISAAGEITAIGGAAKSLIEGRLAGLSILRRMGLLKFGELDKEISALKQARKRQMAFGRYFNAQYSFPSEYMANWIRSLPDDAPVCRCEEVNWAMCAGRSPMASARSPA